MSEFLCSIVMGGSQSVEVPGGGTEGYHVLKVGIGAALSDPLMIHDI